MFNDLPYEPIALLVDPITMVDLPQLHITHIVLHMVLLALLITHLQDHVDEEVIIDIHSGTHIEVPPVESDDVVEEEGGVE